MALTDTLRSLGNPTLSGAAASEAFERTLASLRVCLPAGLRRAMDKRDQQLVLAPRGGLAEVSVVRPGDVQALGTVDPGVSGALAAMVAAGRPGSRRTLVRLPAEEVLTREIVLPTQVRPNLRRVVGYEIDRLTPFQSDQVFFDFRVRDGAARGEDKLAVELALCRRDRAGRWLRHLREAGAPADQVTWEGAWSGANLLPPEERPRRRGKLFSPTAVLALLALVLLVAVLATPVVQKQRQLDQLNDELAALRGEAAQVEEVRAALERARQGSTAVLQRKLDEPRSIDLLRELTVRLPDDTWVQNLDVRDGEVQIRGESGQSTALIGLLEQAAGISGVAFRSPVVQVATTGQERFHISFQYRPPEER